MSTSTTEARADAPPPHGRRSHEWWSEERRDERLRQLRVEGVPTRQIAKRLHCSQGAVARRCKLLEIPVSPLITVAGCAVPGTARAARCYERDGKTITADWYGSTRPLSKRKLKALGLAQPEKKPAPQPKNESEPPRAGWWYGRNVGPEPKAVTQQKIAARATTLAAAPSLDRLLSETAPAAVVLDRKAPVIDAPAPRRAEDAGCRWPMWQKRPGDRCNPEFCCAPRAPAFVFNGRLVHTPYCDGHSRLAYPGYRPRSN